MAVLCSGGSLSMRYYKDNPLYTRIYIFLTLITFTRTNSPVNSSCKSKPSSNLKISTPVYAQVHKSTDVSLKIRDKMINLAFVGDSGVGKSSLLFSYAIDVNPWAVPNDFTSFKTEVDVKNESFDVNIAVCNHPEKIREFGSVDAIVLCFDISKPDSLKSAKYGWMYALRYAHPKVPILLAGLKRDMRMRYRTHKVLYLNEVPQKPLKEKEGKKLANRFDNVHYIECSVVGTEPKTVIKLATKEAMLYKNPRTTSCC
uniref:Miro domain-containing protein n=1 Tax=Steinernema glaseri TaxID=37863 RepID=A0A1I8AHB6_9BILA